MEIAKVLVRTVTRVFYDTEQVIVIDALVNHGAYVPGIALLHTELLC